MPKTRIDLTVEKVAPVLADMRKAPSDVQGQRSDEIVGTRWAVVFSIEYLRHTLPQALRTVIFSQTYVPGGGASASPNNAVFELVEGQQQWYFGRHAPMPWLPIGPF